jgi:hypothetical protein
LTGPRRPAAYICVARASRAQARALRQHAIAEVTSGRGWPEPAVYLDEDDPGATDGYSPALARLVAAISAGRHDAVLVAGMGAITTGPACLIRKLFVPCTSNGVAVQLATPPAESWVQPGSEQPGAR